MDRNSAPYAGLGAVAGLVLALASHPALAARKRGRDTKPSTKTPAALHLRAIDRSERLVHVEVSGFGKAPAANMFTFTDERGRHFVAQTARCEAPTAAGTRACEIEIPAGYERHTPVALTLHLGGLHSRTVAADPAEIAAAWRAANPSAEAAANDGADTAAPAKPAPAEPPSKPAADELPAVIPAR